MAASTTYPFAPRSTASMEAGQFWTVPLGNGRFACGRVLQVGGSEIPTKSRAFFGALLDWVGHAPPTHDSIAGAGILDSGVMHVKAILTTGGEVLGCRPLVEDGIELPTLLSGMGGDGTMILKGADAVRAARRDEWGTLPVLGFWGYDFIAQLATSRLTNP